MDNQIPNQPQTKTLSERQLATLLALLVAVMPFSIDAYLPSLLQIATDLNSDIHHIERSLSSFVLGVALGQLLGGAISDIKGRKNIALVGLGIYMFSSVFLIFVQSADQLLLWRLVQAVGGGMASVMVGAIVRDNYEGNKAAQMFALIGIITMSAPLFAPMVGAMLQMLGGWRAVFVFLLAYSSVVFLLFWRFLPKRKQAEPLPKHLLKNITLRYLNIFKRKEALGFLFFQAASFSSMLVFLTESPFVYRQLYGLSAHQYALAFGCNIITMGTFNRYTAWHLKRDSNPKDILKKGILVQLLANTVLFIITLIGKQPEFWLMVALIMVSVGTQGLIVANTQALFMSHFKEEGGSANAVLMASQSIIGATVGFLVTLLHNGTALIMPMMMLCCTITGLILLFKFSRHAWQHA